MNRILGADTDELRRLRQQMESFSAALQGVGTTTTAHLQALGWHGRDQQSFLDRWVREYHPSLIRTADVVAEAGGVLEQQAADQDRASSGPGGGGGGAGTAAGAVGTGAAAGVGAAGMGATGTGSGTTQAGGGLGSLSSKYESRGKVGSVSPGDTNGGISYGTYQLSTKQGTAAEFVSWLRREHPEYGDRLDDARPGTPEFGRAWKQLAAASPTEFGQIQHDYIQHTHYDPFRAKVERTIPGINVEGRDPVVKDVLWSTAVQHGPDNNVFRNAFAGRDVASMTDAEVVRAVYAERGEDNGTKYFGRSNANERVSVVRRFGNEQSDALARLGQ